MQCLALLLAASIRGTRPLVANLNTQASGSQISGGPIGSNAHVGECEAVIAAEGGVGRLCKGRLYLRDIPGNTGWFEFTNDGDGMIRWGVLHFPMRHSVPDVPLSFAISIAQRCPSHRTKY
jgi:hypothetical protein